MEHVYDEPNRHGDNGHSRESVLRIRVSSESGIYVTNWEFSESQKFCAIRMKCIDLFVWCQSKNGKEKCV